jgi:hypothetical protein
LAVLAHHDDGSALVATAYRHAWRVAAAVLAGLGALSCPFLLALVVVATDPPLMPGDLARLVAALVAAPWLAVWLIARTHRVRIEARDARIHFRRRGLRVEVPSEAIARVSPWIVPLPSPGLSCRMRGGRRLAYAIGTGDPRPLLALLAAGGVAPAGDAAAHPAMRYAAARVEAGGWRRPASVSKFGLFALLPAAILFNAHQHIAYGGSFGQYYLVGLAPYLATFAAYFFTTVLYLILWAGTWRVAGEVAAVGGTWLAPGSAAALRRAVEVACSLTYYGGALAILALRFLI